MVHVHVFVDLNSRILVERLVPNPVIHGVVMRGVTQEEQECMRIYVDSHRQHILQQLNEWVDPITVSIFLCVYICGKLMSQT